MINSMKKMAILLFVGVGVFFVGASSVLAVHVNGYYRSNGTYVNGYERTAPDSSPYNNYSYPGNYNPNKGTITGGSTSSYLNNYYKTSSSGSSYSYPSTITYPTTPTCPSNSYYDGSSSCKCNYGYIVNGSKCVSASLYCMDKIGLMSNYNSLTKSCECMSGYEFNGLSCVYKSKISTPSYSESLLTCPLNSHTSLTDNEKCTCNLGYEPNLILNSCALISSNVFPLGCTSALGFSTTTGASCSSIQCGTGMKLNSKKTKCISN